MARKLAFFAMFFTALLVSAQANATVFDINVFADVTGTDTRSACGPGQVFPYCPLETIPYQASISRYLGPIDLVQGDNPFTYGGYYSSGYITGTINNDNGLLTGRDLTFAYAACSAVCPGDHVYATASTFRVTGGVPEPGTWLTLLLGIGAVAWAARRARVHRWSQPKTVVVQ